MTNPVIGIRLPRDAAEKLDQLCQLTRRTRTQMLALLVDAAVAQPFGACAFRDPCAEASSISQDGAQDVCEV
jgi:hypothetical protein